MGRIYNGDDEHQENNDFNRRSMHTTARTHTHKNSGSLRQLHSRRPEDKENYILSWRLQGPPFRRVYLAPSVYIATCAQHSDGAAMAVESSESGASSNAATDEDAPASTADRNRLTMARGSMRSISSSQIVQAAAAAAASLPAPNANSPAPPVGAPAEVPTPPAVAPTPPPAPAPVRAPVTDSTGALITAQPEMLSCRITAEDEFVLLACDGLFDVFSSEEVGWTM